MQKLIIDNRTQISDTDALALVLNVVKQGKISNNETEYCYGTSFEIGVKKFMVWTNKNKKSIRFVITKD